MRVGEARADGALRAAELREAQIRARLRWIVDWGIWEVRRVSV